MGPDPVGSFLVGLAGIPTVVAAVETDAVEHEGSIGLEAVAEGLSIDGINRDAGKESGDQGVEGGGIGLVGDPMPFEGAGGDGELGDGELAISGLEGVFQVGQDHAGHDGVGEWNGLKLLHERNAIGRQGAVFRAFLSVTDHVVDDPGMGGLVLSEPTRWHDPHGRGKGGSPFFARLGDGFEVARGVVEHEIIKGGAEDPFAAQGEEDVRAGTDGGETLLKFGELGIGPGGIPPSVPEGVHGQILDRELDQTPYEDGIRTGSPTDAEDEADIGQGVGGVAGLEPGQRPDLEKGRGSLEMGQMRQQGLIGVFVSDGEPGERASGGVVNQVEGLLAGCQAGKKVLGGIG